MMKKSSINRFNQISNYSCWFIQLYCYKIYGHITNYNWLLQFKNENLIITNALFVYCMHELSDYNRMKKKNIFLFTWFTFDGRKFKIQNACHYASLERFHIYMTHRNNDNLSIINFIIESNWWWWWWIGKKSFQREK